MTSRAASKPARDHQALAQRFQDDVLAGTFPCGKLFRAAIERQARDLANPPAGYRWNPEAGARACRFMEALPYPEGPKRGQRFRLEPWQVFLTLVLFGWLDPATGYRRFRVATIFLPKGNGKSPYCGLIAAYILATDRTGPKVYSAASAQKQARLVFSAAQELLRLAPDVCKRFGLVVEEHKIRGRDDNRVYEPVSAEAGTIEGIRPALCVLDELHVLPNRKLYDNLKSACNKVDGSLLMLISTAGFDCSGESIGRQLYVKAESILVGKLDEPETFALIAHADPEDDPWCENTWRKANPNYGVSVSIIGLRAAAASARETPSEQPNFKTKHLNIWVQASNRFIDPARWAACARPDLSLDCFKGRGVFVGVDVAQTRDLSSRVMVGVRLRDDGQREYLVKHRSYLPEQSITLRQVDTLRTWAEQSGTLVFTPGEVFDTNILRDDIAADCEVFPGSEVCYDPFTATPMANDLKVAGITCVEIRQGARTQSPAIKELEAAILSGRLFHDGDPVLTWAISNLTTVADRNGGLAPTKESEAQKIDPAVALINALVRAMVAEMAATSFKIQSLDEWASS